NPLYRVRKGKQKAMYVFTETDRDKAVKTLGGNADVTRFKGLGEMNPEDLWETTMNPETRTLLKVDVADRLHAEDVFNRLMGDELQPRKRFITEGARQVKNLDI